MADDEIDPIDEIRAYREEYAKRFNYDLVAIYEDIRSREGKDGRPVVHLEPRRPAGWVPPATGSPPEQPTE